MNLSKQERERYADIVLEWLPGTDRLDAVDLTSEIIEAYQEDQAARQAAMERVIAAARDVRRVLDDDDPYVEDWMAVKAVLRSRLDALDATTQEASDGND